MDEFPNTNPFKITHSWTQPYVSMNPFYQNPYDARLERELDLLDAADLVVDCMTEYPEARKLLEDIQNANRK